MNTCGTCKYFGKAIEGSFDDYLADVEVVVTRMHQCTLLQHLNEDSESKKLALTVPAGVIDGSGYYAAFCVSEEFGCNQWQPLPTSEEPK